MIRPDEDRFEMTERANAETTTYAAIQTARNGFKNPETANEVAASRASLEIYRKTGRQPTEDEISRIMREHNVTRPTAEHVADSVRKVEEAKAKLPLPDRAARYRAALIAEYDEDAEHENDPDEWYEFQRDMMDE